MRSVMKRADRNMISDVVDALQARVQRRRWSDDVKVRIVAESYAPGAVVFEVGRQHEISPQLPLSPVPAPIAPERSVRLSSSLQPSGNVTGSESALRSMSLANFDARSCSSRTTASC